MKKLKDWSIKSKLLLLTSTTILSIVVLSMVSSYFFNTSRFLSIMLNGVRVHQNLLQNGVEELYNYKIHKDPKHLDTSAKHLNEANLLIQLMLEIRGDLNVKTKYEIATDIFNKFPQVFNDEMSNAILLIDRIKTLHSFNNSEMDSSREMAIKTLGLLTKNTT